LKEEQLFHCAYEKVFGQDQEMKVGSWWAISLTSIILFFNGCVTVGPDYITPKVPVESVWHTDLKQGLSATEPDQQIMSAWWATLSDPELTQLIGRAVVGNLELKKAQARIREARARRGVATGGLYPTLDITGGLSRTRISEETGNGTTADLFTLGFDALWEVDLFGGQRRTVEAAQAGLEASREGRHDVLVSLLAEVALNYVEVRLYQARIGTAETNLESQREVYQLTLWRNEAGLIDELSVQQARYALENLRSQIPPLRTALEAAMNRIAVLLGEPPGNIHKELEKRKPIPVPPLELAVGVPADVLRRRPDIRKAERELAAQTARIGSATADLYPKINLSGSIGLETFDLAGLFSLGSRTMRGGLGILWPIFHAGTIRQNIEIQSALQEQALLTYEAAVLSAIEEVEYALTAYAEEYNRRQALLETTLAAQQVVELTRNKFQAGLTDFLDVQEALMRLWSFQDQMWNSEGNQAATLVRLYKALGGGWESFAQKREG
jgi:outer membrane protein, multidrug efflux system